MGKKLRKIILIVLALMMVGSTFLTAIMYAAI